MRIISKFKDYYDTAMGLGQDKRLAYLRSESVVSCQLYDYQPGSTDVFGLEAFVDFMAGRTSGWSSYSERFGHEFSIGFGAVLFAGKVYPFARVNVYSPGASVTLKEDVLYSIGDLAAWCAENGAVRFTSSIEKDRFIGTTRPNRSYGRSWSSSYSWDFSLKDFFALHGSSQFESLALETHTPIAVFERNRVEFLRVNCPLKDYKFYKVLDSWQAFQELEMFMGNIAAPDRVPVTISDRDRVIQYGFDSTSFRRAPSKRI